MKPLELYIHIPFCVRKCDYCDFLSKAYDEKVQQRYTNALLKEIRYMGRQMKEYQIVTLFIGGGTPSWLDEALMIDIIKCVHQSFQVSPEAEVSIECNPGTVTEAKFNVYRSLGMNRISIGLQSANDEELKLLGRIHTWEHFLHTYELARNCGFHNINIDVMTGLPGQSSEKLMHTLQQVVRLKPEHISAYSLIIEPGTPFYEQYKFDAVKQHAGMDTEFLPSEDEEFQLGKMTQQYLMEHGYHQYEISNYAKAGYECKHNIGYWQRASYLGLGIGAASLIEETRYSNVRDIYNYMEKLEALSEVETVQELYSPVWEEIEPVSRKAAMSEFMYLGLRMNCGITRDAFEAYFGVPIEAVYKDGIDKLRGEGLLDMKEGRIFLTEQGQDVSNYALAEFLLE